MSIKPLIPGLKPPKSPFAKVKLSAKIINDELIEIDTSEELRKNMIGLMKKFKPFVEIT